MIQRKCISSPFRWIIDILFTEINSKIAHDELQVDRLLVKIKFDRSNCKKCGLPNTKPLDECEV
jgi:hypothetical protein